MEVSKANRTQLVRIKFLILDVGATKLSRKEALLWLSDRHENNVSLVFNDAEEFKLLCEDVNALAINQCAQINLYLLLDNSSPLMATVQAKLDDLVQQKSNVMQVVNQNPSI